VECELDAELLGAPAQELEVFERAELRMDALVPSLLRSDGPGAARIVGLGGEAIVAALAMGDPDRMDGRQVKDVEAELRHVRQASGAIAQGPVTASWTRRAREHLVPCAEGGTFAIDLNPEHTLVGRGGKVRDGTHPAV